MFVCLFHMWMPGSSNDVLHCHWLSSSSSKTHHHHHHFWLAPLWVHSISDYPQRRPNSVAVSVSYTSSHSILFMSTALSTTNRQFFQMVAFFHAGERPIFRDFKSTSIAYNQVWLGLPTGHFQSDGGFWIATATERCWLGDVAKQSWLVTSQSSGTWCSHQ